MSEPPASAALSELLDRRSELLRFLARKLGKSAAVAEDLLQDALLKASSRIEAVEPGARVAWFHRVLENAVVDHFRRAEVARKTVDGLEAETRGEVAVLDDAPSRVCRCVGKLKDELKPEYRAALERVELDEIAVKDFAGEAGITRQNAAVRAFRAREALRDKVVAHCGHCAKNGCLDCSCVRP